MYKMPFTFILLVMMATFCLAGDESAIPADSTKTQQPDSIIATPVDVSPQVIAYYFHGNRRCVSCKKIESYTQEAIEYGFADRIKSGALQWQVINIDEDENKHYINDYQLYTKSVVLSKTQDGKEISWKNLDKVWNLLNDKDDFVIYIDNELHAFMDDTKE